MTGNALDRIDPGTVALFPGVTPDEILNQAVLVATPFADLVRKQRMFKRIGENDHIQIEAWQSIGALTGVLADEGEVTELLWPTLEPLGEEPPLPGREPRNRDTDEWRVWKRADKVRSAWELHEDMLRARAMGRSFGFKAAFRSAKHGVAVGWGEGRCTRGEASKVGQDDYALSSMAQTRAQSRALGAPLKFIVKLAGYEPTPAEEMDGAAGNEQLEAAQAAAQKMGERMAALEKELAAAKAGEGGSKYGALANDEQEQTSANLVRAIAKAASVDVEGEQFILAMGQHFDGVPLSCFTMLKGLQRLIAAAHAAAGSDTPENAPPSAEQSAYHQPPGPSDADVYPPGPGGTPRYQGD